MTKEQLRILLDKIEDKNSWGKNELRVLILNIAAGLEDRE